MPDMRLAVPKLIAEAPPVAIAPDVHPMPRPTLPMPRIGKQSVDHALVPVRRTVTKRRLQLLRRRWQTDQIQVQPADEHHARRIGLRLQSLLGEAALQKCVDRVAYSLSEDSE